MCVCMCVGSFHCVLPYMHTQIQLKILSSRVKRNALENKRVVNYAIFEFHVSERESACTAACVYMTKRWEKFNSSSLITIHHSPLRELTFLTRKLHDDLPPPPPSPFLSLSFSINVNCCFFDFD